MGACEKQALVDFGCGGAIQLRHVLDGISVDILLVIVCSMILLSVSIGRGEAQVQGSLFFTSYVRVPSCGILL